MISEDTAGAPARLAGVAYRSQRGKDNGGVTESQGVDVSVAVSERQRRQWGASPADIHGLGNTRGSWVPGRVWRVWRVRCVHIEYSVGAHVKFIRCHRRWPWQLC